MNARKLTDDMVCAATIRMLIENEGMTPSEASEAFQEWEEDRLPAGWAKAEYETGATITGPTTHLDQQGFAIRLTKGCSIIAIRDEDGQAEHGIRRLTINGNDQDDRNDNTTRNVPQDTPAKPTSSQDADDEAAREHRRINELLAYSEKRRKLEQWERDHPRPWLGFDPYVD